MVGSVLWCEMWSEPQVAGLALHDGHRARSWPRRARLGAQHALRGGRRREAPATALEIAASARAELAERMSPGERVEAMSGAWVEAVAARGNAAGEVVGRRGVRVVRRTGGR